MKNTNLAFHSLAILSNNLVSEAHNLRILIWTTLLAAQGRKFMPVPNLSFHLFT